MAFSSCAAVRSMVMGIAGLWNFRRTSSWRQNFLQLMSNYDQAYMRISSAYLGPMCPPFMFGAKRRCIFLMSFGRMNAPEPRRMARSLVCSLRMRCGSEEEPISSYMEM